MDFPSVETLQCNVSTIANIRKFVKKFVIRPPPTRRNMKSKSIYRPLFLEAWQTVWQHKRLWLVGIFATAMASGGLFESLSGNW